MFQEFPKCLYLAGDVAAAFCVVLDPQEEAGARKDGFLNAGESQEKAKTPRKPKAH
jgi:hypothetical protein